MSLLTSYLRQRRYQQALKFIEPGQTVLDIGCGDGQIIPYLPQQISYVGVDIHPYQDEIQSKLATRGLVGNFFQFSAEEISGKLTNHRNKFDRILLLAVLEHLEQPRLVLNQLHLLLKKPNGLVIITTPTKLGGAIHRWLAKFNLTHPTAVEEHNFFLASQDFAQVGNLGVKEYHHFEFGLNQLVAFGLSGGNNGY